MNRIWAILAVLFGVTALVALALSWTGALVCGGCAAFCLAEGINSARSARRTAEILRRHNMPARSPSRWQL